MNQKRMNPACFSNNTKDYLSGFHCILDEMIEGMTNVCLTDSISYNFIIQMIPHHEAAIRMSHNLLKYTTFIPLQNIAVQIIEEQTKSIENMRSIQCSCEKHANCGEDVCRYQERVEQILQTMFTEMGNACTVNNINASFMHEMIPHHRGAVRLSENALKYDICSDLRPILDAIITSQKRGIMQMQHLLCFSGCN